MGKRVYIDDLANPCIIDGEGFECAEVFDDGVRKWVHLKTWAEVKAWVKKDKALVHYVGMRERPGVQVFGNLLETRYFWPPGSERNDLFRIHEVQWQEIRWLIYSIPKRLERFATRAAEMASMTIKDAVPVLIIPSEDPIEAMQSHEGIRRHGRWFPLKEENVMSLEFANGRMADIINAVGTGFALRAQEEFIDMNTAAAVRAAKTN